MQNYKAFMNTVKQLSNASIHEESSYVYVKAQFATSGRFQNRPAHFQAVQPVSKLATRFIQWIYGTKFYAGCSS